MHQSSPSKASLTFVAFFIASLVSTAAEAYVCSRVPDSTGSEVGPSLSWYDRSLGYSIAAEGLPQNQITAIEQIVASSFAAWSEATSCDTEGTTDLRFATESCCSSSTAIGYNFLTPAENENLFIYRKQWPHPHQAGNVIALTTTTYNSLSGEIVNVTSDFAVFSVRTTSFTVQFSSVSFPTKIAQDSYGFSASAYFASSSLSFSDKIMDLFTIVIVQALV